MDLGFIMAGIVIFSLSVVSSTSKRSFLFFWPVPTLRINSAWKNKERQKWVLINIFNFLSSAGFLVYGFLIG